LKELKNNSNENISDTKMLTQSITHPADNIKQYLNRLRNNLLPILLIFLASVFATIIYVTNAIDIYRSTTSIKITRPQGNILTAKFQQLEDFQADRFIANEIEILKSKTIKERTTYSLIDSFKLNPVKSDYSLLLNFNPAYQSETVNPSVLTSILNNAVIINQKRGLDIVDITAESPSAYEARLIADLYADAYVQYSLEFSRREVTTIKKFLEKEKEKKAIDLANSEAAIQDYQQKGNTVYLNEQATKLVDRISELELQKNLSEVDLGSNQKAYSEIKTEVSKIDAGISDLFEGQVNETYVKELYQKIAELEVKRDVEATIPKEEKLKDKILNDYNTKIQPLKNTLDEKLLIMKKSLYGNTPEERRNYLQRLFETNLSVQTNRAKLNSISGLLSKYETEFSKLPAQSIEIAKLERVKLSNEKLFLALEEKYQESLVNESSQLGSVIIIDKAQISTGPSKPNRRLMVLAGCFLGLALGIGFASLRSFLDKSIKTPEDIENKGIPVLAWIPAIEELKELGSSQLEFITANNPKAAASESFKALRTRVLFAKLETEPLKTILVTSSIPSEGKTTVALNLAGSFAQSDKKVLLLDCDLRKPRIHAVFESERYPGLSDYLFGNASLEDVTRDTRLPGLKYITSGTIPPNPSELLGSNQMKDFLDKMKHIYDIVVLDSPPFISVTDPEILVRITDGTILVVQANKTPIEPFIRSFEGIMNIGKNKFLGSVLNNFMYKQAYGYYYNYYYYYSKSDSDKKSNKKSTV
jgi:tyrosine-protein kinase Etk/Wzc